MPVASELQKVNQEPLPAPLDFPSLKNPQFWFMRLKQKDEEINRLNMEINEMSGQIQGFEELIKNKSAMID